MRPPYYLLPYRDQSAAQQAPEPIATASGKFAFMAALIIVGGLVAVSFLSGI